MENEKVCPGAPRKSTSHISRVNRSPLSVAGAYPPPAPIKKRIVKAKRRFTPEELELFHSTRDRISQVQILDPVGPVGELNILISNLEQLQLSQQVYHVNDLINTLKQMKLDVQDELEAPPSKRRRIDTPPNSPQVADY